MATFPKLRTEAVTQYPSGREFRASTHVVQFVDGSEQRFANLRQIAKRWMLRLDQVSEQELAAIEEFYSSYQGGVGSFTFIDPWDGMEHTDCSFEADSLQVTLRDHGQCTSTIILRSNQV